MRNSEKRTSVPNASVLRTGRVRIKGHGSLSGWVWKAKSLVLTEQALVTPDYKIPLSHISKVERVDSKPCCLLLEMKNRRRYYLSFEDDRELYDWQEDVYVRCPLIGSGNPFGFVHKVHVGFDPVSGAFRGLPTQWSQTLLASSTTSEHGREETSKHQRKRDPETAPSPLSDTPSLSYTAVTGLTAPDKEVSNTPTVLDGNHAIKGDGLFTGWMWKPRWLVLGARTLTISKSKHSTVRCSIKLRDIVKVERTETRPHCLLIETSAMKRYRLSFKSDEQLYSWRDAIYARSRLSGISGPVDFVHHVHIGINPASGEFTGLPEQWRAILQNS